MITTDDYNTASNEDDDGEARRSHSFTSLLSSATAPGRSCESLLLHAVCVGDFGSCYIAVVVVVNDVVLSFLFFIASPLLSCLSNGHFKSQFEQVAGDIGYALVELVGSFSHVVSLLGALQRR